MDATGDFPGAIRFDDPDEASSYVAVVLGLLGLLLMITIALNVIINPLAAFPHRFVRPVVMPAMHKEKLLLYGKGDRDVLVLGSSRIEKYDPSMVRDSRVPSSRAARGFNGALARTGFVDQAAWALYALDHPGPDKRPPRLIMTLTEGNLSSTVPSAGLVAADALYGSLLRRVPEGSPLRASLKRRKADEGPGAVHGVADAGRVLLGWETTKLSLQRLLAVTGLAPAAYEPVQRTLRSNPTYPYAGNGVLVDRPNDLRRMRNRAGYDRSINDFATVRQELSVASDGGAASDIGVSAAGRQLLRTVIDEANRHDVVPIIVLNPINPDSSRIIESITGRDTAQRIAAISQVLQPYVRSGSIELIDMSGLRLVDPDGSRYNYRAWLDAIHPTSLTARRIMWMIGKRSRQLEPVGPPPRGVTANGEPSGQDS